MGNQLLVDTHVHMVGATQALQDLGDLIRTERDVIDINARYPQLHRDALSQEPIDISDQYVELMERHGISHAIVQKRPGMATNTMVGDIVKRHPDKLFGLLWMTPHSFSGDPVKTRGRELPDERELARRREAAAEEIVYGADTLGLIGVGEFEVREITVELHPERIARDFEPIMTVLSTYRLPIMFHTAWTQFPHDLYYGDPIWVDELAYSYPEVPIILTKMGRGFERYFEACLSVAMRNPNVYLDTVQTTPHHLRKALDILGPDRIMFGSDWSPTWRWVTEPADYYTLRKQLLDEAQLSDEERQSISWRTAARVFRLPIETDA